MPPTNSTLINVLIFDIWTSLFPPSTSTSTSDPNLHSSNSSDPSDPPASLTPTRATFSSPRRFDRTYSTNPHTGTAFEAETEAESHGLRYSSSRPLSGKQDQSAWGHRRGKSAGLPLSSGLNWEGGEGRESGRERERERGMERSAKRLGRMQW